MATKGLFVTGTDTDIGKTYVSCHILRELVQQGKSVGAYKPACSGSLVNTAGKKTWGDVEQLRKATQSEESSERICPQTFDLPLAPDRAAKMESRSVDESLLINGWKWWVNRVDYLLVEGVGGLLSPVSQHFLVADLAVQIGYPLLIIADAGLGTINHTLLTIEAARQRGLSVAGVVLNQTSPKTDRSASFNLADLRLRTDVPILKTVPFRPQGAHVYENNNIEFEWTSLFNESCFPTQNEFQ